MTGSHHIAKVSNAGLKRLDTRDPPASVSQAATSISRDHQRQQRDFFFFSGTGDGTQGLIRTSQVFYRRVIPQPLVLKL